MKHEKVQELTRGSSGTQTSFFSAPLIAHTPIDSSKITWLLVVIKWFHKVADWIVFNCVAFNEPVGCFMCSIKHCRAHTTAPHEFWVWEQPPKMTTSLPTTLHTADRINLFGDYSYTGIVIRFAKPAEGHSFPPNLFHPKSSSSYGIYD